jgi:hypothetical protein
MMAFMTLSAGLPKGVYPTLAGSASSDVDAKKWTPLIYGALARNSRTDW